MILLSLLTTVLSPVRAAGPPERVCPLLALSRCHFLNIVYVLYPRRVGTVEAAFYCPRRDREGLEHWENWFRREKSPE